MQRAKNYFYYFPLVFALFYSYLINPTYAIQDDEHSVYRRSPGKISKFKAAAPSPKGSPLLMAREGSHSSPHTPPVSASLLLSPADAARSETEPRDESPPAQFHGAGPLILSPADATRREADNTEALLQDNSDIAHLRYQGIPSPHDIPHLAQMDAALHDYFGPTLWRVLSTKTKREIVKVTCVLLTAFPSFQVPVPLAITAFSEMGINKNVIPNQGLPSYLFIAGTAVLPLVLGSMGAVEAAGELFIRKPPEMIEAEKLVLTTTYSWADDRTYFWPTIVFETLFWGLNYGLLIAYMESGIKGFGPTEIWEYGFAALMLPILYYLFVYQSNNPEDNPLHERDPLSEIIDSAKEHIRMNGLTPDAEELGRKINAIRGATPTTESLLSRLPSDVSAAMNTQQRPSGSINSANSSDGPSSSGSLRNVNFFTEPRYLDVFVQINKMAGLVPQRIKKWRGTSEKIGRWLGAALQIGSLPMRHLLIYYLPYKLLTSCRVCNVSLPMAAGLSALITVALSPLVCLITYKEWQLTQNEIVQAMRLYKPDYSSNYSGERIAPVIARLAASIYLVISLETYFRVQILEQGIGIHNLAGELTIILPFLIATPFPAGSRAFEHLLKKLGDWVAKGGRVETSCGELKLFPCFDRNRNVRKGLKIQSRLQELYRKSQKLNSKYRGHILQQLRDKGLLTSETSPLLSASSLSSASNIP